MERADSASPAGLRWRISSYCNGGNCVRVAPGAGVVYIGDSRDPYGPVLSYTQLEWRQFVARIKNGDFGNILIG